MDCAIGNLYLSGEVIENYSDERLKDFEDGNVPDALDKIKALNGRYYKVNQKAIDLGQFNPDIQENKMQIGISAQEVQAVLPEIVQIAPFADDELNASNPEAEDQTVDQDYLTINYKRLTAVLVEAVKELSDKMDALS
jgi:hypothetical protein